MLSGIATAILDNIINTIFDNIDKSVNDEHNMFFVFNELTVELTTDSSYLGQGAGRRVITGGGGESPPCP